MGAQCTAALLSFKLPNLKAKNKYDFLLSQKQIDDKKLNQLASSMFYNNQQLTKQQRSLLGFILSSQTNNKFADPNFAIVGQRLSNLYDYKRKMMKLYSQQNKNGSLLLSQQEVQFSYLSAVMYFLCQNKQFLRRRILLNNEINYDKQIYWFRLFCNGQEHNVLIDDIVPVTSNNNLKFCLLKEKEIWPVLLEKAWCKMIGGYDKARGLSPQECFEEITGLPASSIRIQFLNQMSIYSDLQKLQEEGNWLCVVAYYETEFLKPGQVFVVEKLDDESICLVSPYTEINSSFKEQNRPGYLKIQFHKFRNLFEYLIIGYHKKGYSPVSKKVNCEKREQKLYELNVNKKEDVSIRFTQFFSGYMEDSQKSNYDYSPLATFELYDSKGILHFCQGCDRLHSGSHSVYFTKSIFHSLNKGVYYLRLEVDWEQPSLIREGNIVIYASQNNVQIQQVTDKSKVFSLHHQTLENPKSVVISDQTDELNRQYELRFIEKQTNILVSIQNKVDKLLRLQLNFQNSENFRVKYAKLQKDKKVLLNLAPLETKYLEILPQQSKSQFKIEPFTVKKLNNSQL